MALIVLGGLGFLVLYNISSIRVWKRNRLLRGRLSLHSALFSPPRSPARSRMGGFGALELESHAGGFAVVRQVVCALFQSVTAAYGGFNVVDMAQVQPATLFLTMCLMFIGGSPGSTAGGIKTTTLVVLWLAMVSMIRGREETHIRRRALSPRVAREALTIFLLGLMAVAICLEALLISEYRVAPAATQRPMAVLLVRNNFGFRDGRAFHRHHAPVVGIRKTRIIALMSSGASGR